MKYLVTSTLVTVLDMDSRKSPPTAHNLEEGDDMSIGSFSVESIETTIATCETTRDVFEALQEAGRQRAQWHVFELVGGKYVRRAVTYKYDGRRPYDVEVV